MLQRGVSAHGILTAECRLLSDCSGWNVRHHHLGDVRGVRHKRAATNLLVETRNLDLVVA